MGVENNFIRSSKPEGLGRDNLGMGPIHFVRKDLLLLKNKKKNMHE